MYLGASGNIVISFFTWYIFQDRVSVGTHKEDKTVNVKCGILV